MTKVFFLFLFFTSLFWGTGDLLAQEETDTEPTDEEPDMTDVATVCQHLQEKIQIVLPVQNRVSEDFARVSDPYLCRSMATQCEYFYTLAKFSQREYRDTCDADYRIVKVEKCDYSVNPCVKEVRKAGNNRHALVYQKDQKGG